MQPYGSFFTCGYAGQNANHVPCQSLLFSFVSPPIGHAMDTGFGLVGPMAPPVLPIAAGPRARAAGSTVSEADLAADPHRYTWRPVSRTDRDVPPLTPFRPLCRT